MAIVGAGRIGNTVARRLEGFDCEVIRCGRERPQLERALERADFVTVHTPLTDDTRGPDLASRSCG